MIDIVTIFLCLGSINAGAVRELVEPIIGRTISA